MWIDTHCHLDAAEFDPDREAVVARARAAGVGMLVLPAVDVAGFARVRELAHAHRLSYALGIHPLYVGQAADADLQALDDALQQCSGDPRLVAVGEIGLDLFVPGLDAARQQRFYLAQLGLARRAGLPVLLHVRKAVDPVLAGLRRMGTVGGIAHAFNGSLQQARQLGELGLKLGFGGALTHPRALHLRRLVAEVDAGALVLETDAPDIPPQWLYRPAAERATDPAAIAAMRNQPAEAPRIAADLAMLRGWSLQQAGVALRANTLQALPRLAPLLED